MEKSGEYFKALFEISSLLSSSLDPAVVLDTAMDQVLALTGGERGFILLKEEGELRVQAARNLDQETVEASREISNTLVNRVLASGKAEMHGDALADPDLKYKSSVVSLRLRSVMCAPLRQKEETIGVIYLDNRGRGGVFSPDDLEMLEAFANSAAIAIENARLYRKLEEGIEDRLALQAKVLEKEKRAAIAEELNNLREELAHYLVHDLKNPLSIVIFGLSMIRESVEQHLEARQMATFSSAVANAELLESMVNSILDVYRLESGDMPIQCCDFNLRNEIAAAMADARAYVSEKVELRFDAPSTSLMVHADPNLTRRTLENLLSNASRFTDQGHIEVKVAPTLDGRMIQVEVSDTGCGIRTEHLDRIFDKFKQLESKRRGDRASSGLGLTFCKLAVERQRGRIWAEADEGRGSAFIFTLPRARRVDQVPPAIESDRRGGG